MPRPLSTEIKEEIVRLYKDEKMSEGDISKKLGIAKSTAGTYVRLAGLTRTLEERMLSLRSYKNPRWKGGRQISGGYVYVLAEGHPRAGANDRVAEHIFVWEKANNKILPSGWVVHHLNGIGSDNRPSNLVAMSCSKHNKLLPELQRKIRELEIENKQLKHALDSNQSIFYINEN